MEKLENINSELIKEKVIITSLSLIKNIFPESEYDIDNSVVGNFRFTNEPVLSYLLEKYKDDDLQVIEFCSHEVYKPKDEDLVIIDGVKQSTYNYYNSKFNIKNHFVIEYENDNVDTQKCIKELIEKLFSKNNNPKELYVDMSGGLRDFTTVLVSLCDYLSFKNIEIKEIYSTTFPRDSKDGKGKINHSDIKEILNFSRAITRFTQDGNSRKLVECLGDNSRNLKQQLTEYSNDVILNDLEEFTKHYDDLKNGLDEWKNNYDKSLDHTIIDSCMYYSIEQIKEKLYMNSSDDDIYTKEPSLKLLRWCLDNDLLIQALAIYDEKIPELYYKYNIVCDEIYKCIGIDVSESEIPLGKNDKQFYYLSQPKEKKLYIKLLKDFCKKYFYDSSKQGVYIGDKFDLEAEFKDLIKKPYYAMLKFFDDRIPNFISMYCDDLRDIKNAKESDISIKIESLYNNAFSKHRNMFYSLNSSYNSNATDVLHDTFNQIVNIRNSKVHINVSSNSNFNDCFDNVKNKLRNAMDLSVNELNKSLSLMNNDNLEQYKIAMAGGEYEYSNMNSALRSELFGFYSDWNRYFS